jgi:DNA-binding GntR family transcriptional regulator
MATDKKLPDEYERLRTMIVRGEVLPNERLVEAEYAEKLDTNRANIRRALARLEQEGLVVCEPFRGARVRSVSPDEAVEIFEVRGVLEVLVAGHAAKRATVADVRKLDELMRKLKESLGKQDPIAVGGTARKVREELWRISGHGTASRILGTLNSQLVRLWYRSVLMPGRAETITATMQAVVDAVRNNDAKKASQAMRQHHDGAIASLMSALQRESLAQE